MNRESAQLARDTASRNHWVTVRKQRIAALHAEIARLRIEPTAAHFAAVTEGNEVTK